MIDQNPSPFPFGAGEIQVGFGDSLRTFPGNFLDHRAGRDLLHPSGFFEIEEFAQKQNTPESPLPINS
jgi:hypothetical protein